VRIYSRALDQAEVDADMEAPIQTPKQGPVAAWSFNEGTGTTAEDMTGDGNTATIEGAEWARGKYEDALKFDGEDDVVKVPNSPEFDLTEGFSLEAWVRPESESNQWAPILAKEMGGGKATEELAWWLYDGGEKSNVPFGGNGPTAGKEEEAIAEDPLPIDVWSHLALIYDGFQLRLYVDGNLVDCSDVPAQTPPTTEGELQIGAATEHGDYFDGRIDEVRLYNRALTVQEIQEDEGEPIPPPQITYAVTREGEEGEVSRTALTAAWSGSPSETGSNVDWQQHLYLSLTSYGGPEGEETTMSSPMTGAPEGTTVEERPYRFNYCVPIYTGGGTPVELHPPFMPPVREKFESYLKETVEESSKSPQCHGDFPVEGGPYNFAYAMAVHGHFSYTRGVKVWVSKAPKCNQWSEVELPKEQQKTKEETYAPEPAEFCYATAHESLVPQVPTFQEAGAHAKIDVIGDWVFSPAKKFDSGLGVLGNVCASIDGVLPPNPPEPDQGEWPLHSTVHVYRFLSGYTGAGGGHPFVCHWAHPQNQKRELLR